MEDYRLEQQKNTAARILTRAPLLNLYAHKNCLPPAVARFRLLQVLSQSCEEADPSLAAELLTAAQPLAAQAPGAPQPHPEEQPAQHAALEPEQGPQPRPAPYIVDEEAEPPLISSSDSGTDIDWPSDLEADSEDGILEHPHARAAAEDEAAAVALDQAHQRAFERQLGQLPDQQEDIAAVQQELDELPDAQ